MKRLVALVCVGAAVAVAVWLALRTSSQPRRAPGPQLDALVAQCDAQGSSFAAAYDRAAARLPELVGSDRATALAATRGQVANLVSGRLATCEQALAIAQHDRQGLVVVRIGAFTRRVAVAQAALKHLEAVLDGSGDAPAALADLSAAVHATTAR